MALKRMGECRNCLGYLKINYASFCNDCMILIEKPRKQEREKKLYYEKKALLKKAKELGI